MILIIEEKIVELRYLKNQDTQLKKEDLETSDIFFNSPVQTQKVRVTYNSFTNGTASGGLLYCGEKTSLMPKMQENQPEAYFHKQDDESYHMYIESQEKIGCCRSKFFCF